MLLQSIMKTEKWGRNECGVLMKKKNYFKKCVVYFFKIKQKLRNIMCVWLMN